MDLGAHGGQVASPVGLHPGRKALGGVLPALVDLPNLFWDVLATV